MPMSRRDVLKRLALTGGAVAAAPYAGVAAHMAPAKQQADPLLAGICDIHIHAAPDVKPRRIDELDFARRAKAAGYRAVMYKANEWSSHDRAYLIEQAVPGLSVFGGFCMNPTHGSRVNPYAAKMAVQTTGNRCRCIWMPTQAAVYQHAQEHLAGPVIPVTDPNGHVLPEVAEVMEICAEADIMFATGHSSPAESVAMARKAKEIGLKKFVVTHANSRIWKLTEAQIDEIAALGGWIEYCFLPNLCGPGTGLPNIPKATAEEFIAYVSLCPERSFVSTDLGQTGMPDPLDGMKQCIQTMQSYGMSQQTIDTLTKRNPAHLVGLL